MNSTFLSDFIMITNFKTIAFIIVLIAILFGVNIMAKKKDIVEDVIIDEVKPDEEIIDEESKDIEAVEDTF